MPSGSLRLPTDYISNNNACNVARDALRIQGIPLEFAMGPPLGVSIEFVRCCRDALRISIEFP